MRFKTFLAEKAMRHELIVKKVDIFQSGEFIIYPFNVCVEYKIDDADGEITLLKIIADEDVKLLDQEEKPVRTVKAGTPIDKIPGYEGSFENFFYKKVLAAND